MAVVHPLLHANGRTLDITSPRLSIHSSVQKLLFTAEPTFQAYGKLPSEALKLKLPESQHRTSLSYGWQRRLIAMSWLWRGFQSAVFYYLSCAPCTKIAYQRRRHKATQRARAERAATEMEHGLYQHPSPFSTNIYWREEMALGPGPPQRNRNKDRERGRAESSRGLRSGGAGSSSVAGTSSADTVVEMELGIHRERYQREDENLWGVSSESITSMSRSSTTGSRTGYYYLARNPAVNDLHPPVVSTQPTHPSQTRWMLQPPPSAKIMEGKMISSRRRSGSGVSNLSDSSRKRDDKSLGRKVGERLLEGKVKRGEGSGMFSSRSVSASTSVRRLSSRGSAKSESQPQGQPHDRDESSPDNQNMLPVTSSSTDVDGSPPPRRATHLRPPLSTIASVANVPSSLDANSASNVSARKPLLQTVNVPAGKPLLQPIDLPDLATNPALHLSLHLHPKHPSNNSDDPDQHRSAHEHQAAMDLSVPYWPEDQDFGGPVRDQWWSDTRGEMDWRFSLDTRQKQLVTEQERDRGRIARWSMDI